LIILSRLREFVYGVPKVLETSQLIISKRYEETFQNDNGFPEARMQVKVGRLQQKPIGVWVYGNPQPKSRAA
jgi:hypothetical protein